MFWHRSVSSSWSEAAPHGRLAQAFGDRGEPPKQLSRSRTSHRLRKTKNASISEPCSRREAWWHFDFMGSKAFSRDRRNHHDAHIEVKSSLPIVLPICLK